MARVNNTPKKEWSVRRDGVEEVMKDSSQFGGMRRKSGEAGVPFPELLIVVNGEQEERGMKA